VWPFAKEKIKRSTISLKKAGLIYDLIEKIWPENDLVYDLTEIDRRLWLGCSESFPHSLGVFCGADNDCRLQVNRRL
jgi:hypothetical protein